MRRPWYIIHNGILKSQNDRLKKKIKRQAEWITHLERSRKGLKKENARLRAVILDIELNVYDQSGP